ncbi:MAG: dipeptidase [Clostridiales bacterium]|nr:dipeptidase [Clostridiales bacterium]
MKYIDLHADTITMLKPGETLENNKSKMINIAELKKAGCLIQCFSAFVPTGYFPKICKSQLTMKAYGAIVKKFNRETAANSMLVITSFADVMRCAAGAQTGAMLTIEDGGVLGHDICNIKKAYDDGVRLITLTWNHPNALGFPNSKNANKMQKGLTEYGIEAVREMQRLGIIVDVSHLSDGGFWDVAKHSTRPFVASHSNARSITNHPRNLTDEMIKAVANSGGIIGLNFYGKFLNEQKVGKISDMVAHAKHIYKTGGEDVLALGSDFDGISGKLEISRPTDIEKLYRALKSENIPQTVIDKMWKDNALRLFKETL